MNKNMIITPVIEETLRKEAENIQRIELTYLNGGTASGTIKRLQTDPLDLLIRKNPEKRWGGGTHHAVFDHVVKISITLRDNSVMEWKDIK